MSQTTESLPIAEGAPADDRAEFRPPNPWTLQARVIKAIVLRNMTARYSESRLGYLAGLVLPVIGFAAMYFVFGLRGRVAPADFPIAVFLLTGYMVWQAFRQMYSRIMNSASKVDSLLMFPQITQLDLIFAEALLQFVTESVTFVVLVIIVSVFTHVAPANITAVLLLYWAMMWLGATVGLLLCAVQRIAPMVVQVINMFLRLLMWVSGVVFTIDRIPSIFWPYLKWNPLLHCIEGLRESWVPIYEAPIFDPTFIISMCFVLTMLGLTVERVTRRFVGS